MKSCELCPRRCGADRDIAAGYCHSGKLKVARAAPHFGEEPCISGERGSGAVFFAGCPLGCVFCQNYRLSRSREGSEISTERLSEIFHELETQGVHNLNLVTGTQFVPEILQALRTARPSIPVAWNSSGYERPETVRALAKYVNIWMPDYKYALSATASMYSHAPDYPGVARAAIREMFSFTGPYDMDESGLLRSGVIIRHLVLPGQLENTRRVIEWVADTFDPGDVLFSFMAQFTPCGECASFPEINRTLTAGEWDRALKYLEESGIEDGFVQELNASGEEMIPAFDGTGI